MKNPNYYQHNNVNVPAGDENDGRLLPNGMFLQQQEGR
jgi:hypothetical protein